MRQTRSDKLDELVETYSDELVLLSLPSAIHYILSDFASERSVTLHTLIQEILEDYVCNTRITLEPMMGRRQFARTSVRLVHWIGDAGVAVLAPTRNSRP